MLNLTSLVIFILATYRLSHMLAYDYGPLDIISKFRHFSGVRYDERSIPYGINSFSKGMICMYCNSIWWSVIITLLYLWLGDTAVWLSLPLALSGFVVLVLEGK